jgi:hypothetical protein
MKYFLLITLTVFGMYNSPQSVYAQQNSSDTLQHQEPSLTSLNSLSPSQPNRIGIQGSLLSGVGIFYSRQFNDVVFAKITSFYLESRGKDHWLSTMVENFDQRSYTIGGELQFTFRTRESNRLYAFTAFHYGDSKNVYNYVITNDLDDSVDIGEQQISKNLFRMLGNGLGWEFILGAHFSLHTELGVTYIHQGTDDTYFGPAIGAGISFAF